MKNRSTKQPLPELIWREEAKTLTLEGEPVLTYQLSWPELQNAGLGGSWINRYYARQAQAWRLRWQQEVYWKACLELADRRASARIFSPWTGKLAGEVALWEKGVLSLRMEGEEIRGDEKPCRVRWGDVWKVKEGAPCPPGELFTPRRGWKKRAMDQVLEQGRQRRAAGDCFLDPDWESGVKKWFSSQDLCLTTQGVEIAFPQGTIAPAAEGTPVFLVKNDAVL